MGKLDSAPLKRAVQYFAYKRTIWGTYLACLDEKNKIIQALIQKAKENFLILRAAVESFKPNGITPLKIEPEADTINREAILAELLTSWEAEKKFWNKGTQHST